MPPKKKDGENKSEKGHESDSSEQEYASATPRISFTDLEKSMTAFSGDDAYGIETWITEFEDVASLMEWSDLEKLIYSKRLLSGTARLFLRSLKGVKKWSVLKNELKEEFCSSLNSAALHKRLASRKMKTNETYQQYFLHMKEIALLGSIEDEALMEYVIDGIRDTESNKSILYGASNMKEFRKKLELYSEIRKKIDTKTQNSNPKPSSSPGTSKGDRPKPKIRCYNCGSTDHFSEDCTKGVKCFKCNTFEHKSTECRNKEKQQLQIQETDKDHCVTPYKDVRINNASIKALIDTGSDVNLVKESYFDEVNCKNYNQDSVLCLKGIGDHEIHTKGSFLANIQIDDCYFDAMIHVVEDEAIPVNVILGNPILNDVEVIFSPGGISARRVMHLTALGDFEEHSLDVAPIGCKDEIKTMIQDYNPMNPEKESNVELKIILNDETPIHQNPRRLSPLELDVVNTQISEWVNVGIITSSKSDFASPVVLTKKKNGILCKVKDGHKLTSVPKKMQTEIIRKNHEKGHLGVKMRDKNDETLKLIHEEHIANFNEERDELRKKAKESIQKIQHENRRNFNSKRKEATQYNVGDLVAIKRTQFVQGYKLYPKYLGPYEIVKVKRNHRYDLKKVGIGDGPNNTSSCADQMKQWVVADDSTHSSETDE